MGESASLLSMSSVEWKTAIIVGYYALCSSTLLVINKVTIHNLPAPTTILYIQLGFTAAVIWACGRVGVVEVDRLEWGKVKSFIFVTLGFAATLFANMKTLQHSNVETFITFRSSTPLVISVLDYIYLGRDLPGLRSAICLIGLLVGSAGYMVTDSAFKVEAYLWLLAWYVAFSFDTVWVKHVCNTVKMTNWGRSYYNNLLALVPLVFLLPGEVSTVRTLDWSPVNVWAPLLLSCAVGLAMSHSSFVLRSTLSATAATVVGICCKVATVIINCLIWDNHATPVGIAMLGICLVSGTLYQQAPMRGDVAEAAQRASSTERPSPEEAMQPLLKHRSSKDQVTNQQAADVQV